MRQQLKLWQSKWVAPPSSGLDLEKEMRCCSEYQYQLLLNLNMFSRTKQPCCFKCSHQVNSVTSKFLLKVKQLQAVCMKYHGQLAASEVLGYQRMIPGKQPLWRLG